MAAVAAPKLKDFDAAAIIEINIFVLVKIFVQDGKKDSVLGTRLASQRFSRDQKTVLNEHKPI